MSANTIPWTDIVKVIRQHKKPKKIILYGSRADGSFRETSDIDLAIVGKDWSDTDINLVKNQLEETIRTPLKFDLVHFEGIVKDSLKKSILKKGRILYES